MPLADLRIQRSAVPQNAKCEGCVHYDGNAAAKAGACDVGTQPFMCGDGSEPRFGYAPLEQLAPEMIDDLATPVLSGSVGAMNEHGDLEKPIQMVPVVLGDEQMSIAERIHGQLMTKSFAYEESQGETNLYAPSGPMMRARREPSTLEVAKALRTQYLSPRMQKKYTLRDVVEFLGKRGFMVTAHDLAGAQE